MTCDGAAILVKAARAHPKARLVLRITADGSRAVCRLSVKCGATHRTSRLLVEPAKERNVDIIGVSFYVGCSCIHPETCLQATSDAHCVLDVGAEVGFNMYLLDIGGGSPGSEDVKLKFEEITSVINLALAEYFPSDWGLTLIVEPGRYYVASAFTPTVNIFAKNLTLKEQTCSDDEDELSEKTFPCYMNDGAHGPFDCILCDHAHTKLLLQKRPKPDEKCYSSSTWGPTCDGLDRLAERYALPEMHVGDRTLFENMGAYTVAAASTSSGFQRLTVYYVMPGPASASPEPQLSARRGGAGRQHSASVLLLGEWGGAPPSSRHFSL